MDHLVRDIPPIPGTAWSRLDEEARERLTPLLAARRVVDWHGADGWSRSAHGLGRTDELADPPGPSDRRARARLRRVLPLAEVRVGSTVDRAEIDAAERGATDLDLDNLDRAAREAAELEKRVVIHGGPDAGIEGIGQVAPARDDRLGEDTAAYPTVVAAAVNQLRQSGVEVPYALAVPPKCYTRIIETTRTPVTCWSTT